MSSRIWVALPHTKKDEKAPLLRICPNLCIGLEDEVFEMGWGNLGYDRVHRYDDVHAFFQIEVGHLQPQFRGVGHQLLDILGVLAHRGKKFVPLRWEASVYGPQKSPYRAVLSPTAF